MSQFISRILIIVFSFLSSLYMITGYILSDSFIAGLEMLMLLCISAHALLTLSLLSRDKDTK